jgi:hypothetical protein
MIADANHLEARTVAESADLSGVFESQPQVKSSPISIPEVNPRRAAGRALVMVAHILRRPRRRFVRLSVEGSLSWRREHRDLAGALIRLDLR